jgi:hypothetical protein
MSKIFFSKKIIKKLKKGVAKEKRLHYTDVVVSVNVSKNDYRKQTKLFMIRFH